MQKQMTSADKSTQVAGLVQQASKSYTTPKLKILGKLSTVTLGGSVGIGDSGSPDVPEKPAL